MSDKIIFFIKFIDKERVHDFVDEGIFYMNSLKYFRECEEQEARGDTKEGTSYLFSRNTKIEVSGKDVDFNSASLNYDYEECINILSMTAIKKSAIKYMTAHHVVKFNPMFEIFGDTAIIIPEKHIETFMGRIKNSFEENRYLVAGAKLN